VELVKYTSTDLLKLIALIVKLENEYTFGPEEVADLTAVSNASYMSIMHKRPIHDYLQAPLMSVLFKNNLYPILFEVKFKDLPTQLNTHSLLVKLLTQWRLENGT